MTDNSTADSKANASLKRKHAARIAAVQCVYAASMNPSVRMTALVQWQLEQSDEDAILPVMPEKKLLQSIAVGAAEHDEALESHLRRILTQRWEGKRMGLLMRAIFKCAAYEFLCSPKLGTRIIIDQYTGVADAFLDDNDVSFVNAVVLEISRDLRAQEIAHSDARA